MIEPFAIKLYRRFLKGEPVERLAAELRIPPERVEQRVRAARLFIERQRQRAA